MGDYLDHKLQELSSHPMVGDIRGIGLMRGIEFVEDKETRKPFDPKHAFSARLAAECLKRGMFIEYASGCNRGQSGDMIMFGPPFIINETQIDKAIEILKQALRKDLLSHSSDVLTF